MTKYKFAYGHDSIILELPFENFQEELKSESGPAALPAVQIVADALKSPIGFAGSQQHLLEPFSTTIVLPDKTRNCGAPLFLFDLLNYLNDAGIPDSEITILLANGSHFENNADEINHILGKAAVSRVGVKQHDSKDKQALVFLGTTKFGTPVNINSHITGAEQVIAVGTAVHHYFAGFGGGAKMINPGCAGYETIRINHALTIDSESGGLHPQCRPGNVEGNPVQEDISDAMRFLKPPLLLETVLDAQSQLVAAFWGEIRQTHKRACDLVDAIHKVHIDERADLVVASCGGFPKDINLIQAHKALCNAFQAVKPGGVVMLLAECSQGLGSLTLSDCFACADISKLVEQLAKKFTLNGTTALSLHSKARDATIILVTSLAPELLGKLNIHVTQSPEEGWRLASTFLPDAFRCYVMPNASLTLPEGK